MNSFPVSKYQRDALAKELKQDFDKFNTLLLDWINGEVDDRYWWAFTFVIEKHPEWIKNHLDVLLYKLQTTDKDDIKRNITRSLQFVKIPEQLTVLALDLSYQILKSEAEKTAQRVFSMTVIHRIVNDYPDLQNEFEDVLTDLYPYGSAGFKSRANKIIKELANKDGKNLTR